MDRIRRALAGDSARLAEIEVFDYRQNFYPIFRTDRYFFGELTVPALIRDYEAAPEKLAHSLIYDDGIVKGFVRVNGDMIEKLFVEPAFQGLGIGSMLLECAIELGGRRLLVLEKNAGAIRLYKRHGFADTGLRQRVDDTDEFFSVMVLDEEAE